MLGLVGLALATLISEDATAVLAGVLIAQGVISPVSGVLACAIGIYAGDLLLFAAGRFLGRRALRWRPVARALTPERSRRWRAACGGALGPLVLGSRFLPGTRLPLYVFLGAIGSPVRAFAVWSAIAVAAWTPLVVLISGQILPAWNVLATWPAQLAAGSIVLAVWRYAAGLLAKPHLKDRAAVAISRIWRWEFWPMWLFYMPVAVWIAWLIVKHRSVGVIAAANPGIANGGIVGESKHEILTRLPAEWTIPSLWLEPGSIDARASRFAQAMCDNRWEFPVVFKPDVGQRGTGVKLVRSLDDARRYFAREARAVVVQPYHPGPYEAGVFYFRMPWLQTGRILSITDKHFPAVTGDGRTTLEDLVWTDRRLRMQAATFLSRHASELARVPAAGERVSLAIAGNHCQGTLFKDGRHLITPALEKRVDAIARSYAGFFIGRFDIRYTDVEHFKAGEDLAIVELNGATAESTNIYDPDHSLVAAYRQLFTQWSLVFAIGRANRAAGAPATSLARLFHLVRGHLAAQPAFNTSD